MRAHSLLSQAATACMVAASRTAAPAASSTSVRARPWLPAERLMEACWEGMSRLRPAVSICWEGALRRRPELSGGRSVQLVVGGTGG